MEANLKAFGGVTVTIVEEYTGLHGKKWIRAITKNGHRIVAPANLFHKTGNLKAIVNPADFLPELTKGIDNLQKKFHKA